MSERWRGGRKRESQTDRDRQKIDRQIGRVLQERQTETGGR